MDGDHEAHKDATLLDYLHTVPMLVFEEIAKNLSPGDLKKIEIVVPSLKSRCKAASRLITYKPFDICLVDGKVVFQGDLEHVVLLPEEFKETKYKADTPLVHLGILDDNALKELMEVFDGRVQALELDIHEICCDINKLAQLIANLKITKLRVGSGYFANVPSASLPVELAEHPVMQQITSLHVSVSLKNHNLDVFLKKHYTTFYAECNQSNDKAVAETLHNVLEEWLKSQRIIDDITITGVDLTDHIRVLLKNYIIVDEEDENKENNANTRPIVVRLDWDEPEEEVYKLIRQDNNNLFIHLHDGSLTLDKDRPIDIDYDDSELFDEIAYEMGLRDEYYSDVEDSDIEDFYDYMNSDFEDYL